MSRRFARLFATCAGVALLGACAHRVPEPVEGLPAPVRQALEKAGLPAEALAVVVRPLTDGYPPALLHQADRSMQPASAMKVVTAAVALDRLGPNGRGYTELRTAAPIAEGRLQGDLVLRGGADLELGLPQLWALLLELREAGVHTIEGDIVLDRTLFQPARLDIGLPPFDESPEFPYNVIPDALQLAGNLQVIELQSDRQQVRARLRPSLPGVVVDNQLQVHDSPEVSCREWSSRGWRTPESVVQSDGQVVVRLQGRFPANCSQRPALQLMERNLQAQAQLRWVWAELGGRWNGRVREAMTGEFRHEAAAEAATTVDRSGPGTRTRLLARREARPWGEWLRPLNKTSDNVATRVLYLLMGLEEARRAATVHEQAGERNDTRQDGQAAEVNRQRLSERSTRDWAEASVRRWFSEHGIALEGLVMDNGSGLSRSERITPNQLAQVLAAARSQLFAPELMMSLPIAGVDGSLRSRMTDSPARGRARLKPGTLRNVVALAGYVEDVQGRTWVMAAMINHDEAPQRGRPVLDAIADWVAAGGHRCEVRTRALTVRVSIAHRSSDSRPPERPSREYRAPPC